MESLTLFLVPSSSWRLAERGHSVILRCKTFPKQDTSISNPGVLYIQDDGKMDFQSFKPDEQQQSPPPQQPPEEKITVKIPVKKILSIPITWKVVKRSGKYFFKTDWKTSNPDTVVYIPVDTLCLYVVHRYFDSHGLNELPSGYHYNL